MSGSTMMPSHWSDFERALFLLDAAQAKLAADPMHHANIVVRDFLFRHGATRSRLGAEYVLWTQHADVARPGDVQSSTG